MQTSCCLLVLGIVLSARDGDELADFARAAHRASVDAIHQFSCRVECENWHQAGNAKTIKTTKWTAQYWREGDKARAIQTDDKGAVRDLFGEGDRIKSLEYPKDRRTVAGGIFSITEQNITECDAFARALFRLPLPNSLSSLPLDQLLAQATRVYPAERSSVDGHEQVVLHFDSERPYAFNMKWKVTIYLDPTVNYLVRRFTCEHPAMFRDYKITAFEELAPSVYIPSAAVYEVTKGGKLTGRETTVFREIEINRPLPTTAFSFRFPRGLLISDGIRSANYRVDEMGNPISAQEPKPQGITLFGTNGPAGDGDLAATRPSSHEPTPWTAWLPFVFGAIFLLAAMLWVSARWRARRSGTV
jgi:hypothetical protein